jgi:hypothetical protein
MTRCPSEDWDTYNQEPPEECPVCKRPNWDEEKDEAVCEECPDFCSEHCARKYSDGQYATIMVDKGARYLGSDVDGGYYQVGEGPDGWYVSNLIDSDTGGFVDSLVTDDGPYETEEKAWQAGRDGIADWCIENGVNYEDEKEDE